MSSEEALPKHRFFAEYELKPHSFPSDSSGIFKRITAEHAESLRHAVVRIETFVAAANEVAQIEWQQGRRPATGMDIRLINLLRRSNLMGRMSAEIQLQTLIAFVQPGATEENTREIQAFIEAGAGEGTLLMLQKVVRTVLKK